MKNLPLRQFLQFAAVGLTGTAVQYACIQIAVVFELSLLGKLPAVTGSAVGYILGSISNYILNYFLTFRSGKSHVEAAAKYFTILAVGWLINLGMMTLFVAHWGWWHWYGQVLTTGFVLCWNFGGSKFWAFK